MKFIATIFGVLAAGNVMAATGDVIYVQGDVVNMREAPSTEANIVLKLHEGQKMLEIQQKGDWVEVGVYRTGGKSGWVHSSFVGNQILDGAIEAFADPKFDKFNAAFSELNSSIKRESGILLFTKAENLGDGIVQVTATDTWLSAPESERQSSLQTIFNLWDEVEDSESPIAIYIVDKDGIQQMSKQR